MHNIFAVIHQKGQRSIKKSEQKQTSTPLIGITAFV
jgi:hypothetical protein